jgi:undecaprenyl-phosphate 4-deoxy-4-formamido-L-arabinose transferase
MEQGDNTREKKTVSVVIPCYYSEKMIAKVVRLTREELVRGGYDYEFVLVNDGSTDGTFAEIEKLAAEDPKVVGINCSINLGQHSALIAGMTYARGYYTLLMDDDMQTHPSQCLKLLEAIEDGDHDVVFARWEKHREAWWRLAGSAFTTWTMVVMTGRPKDIFTSNFLVMKSHVRDEITRYPGPYVYIQGLLYRATSDIINVDVEHFEREEGQSGYTLKTLVKLWSTILNFSMLPLRAASIIGSILGVVGLIGGIAVVINKLLDPSMAAGWPSIMAVLLCCSGVILVSLGLIGEYLGRTFMTVNRSPQYVIGKMVDNRPAE